MIANANENSGCMGIIFRLFGRKAKESTELLPYRLKDNFLSTAELSFFRILPAILGSERVVQSKVRLADIFFVARPNENAGFFSKISSKHLDFLVCDALTMKPLLGIELDDASHQRADRMERDEFVDQVFRVANLPLVHVSNQRSYNTKEIEALLAPFITLKNSASNPNLINQPSPAPQILEKKPSSPIPAPVCPKCGIPMVVRTVSQGEHKGKQFYGCANFPNCREVKPYKV